MVSDHGTKYEENPSNHHEGMCKERQTGWAERQTGLVPIFPDSAIAGQEILYSPIPEQGITKFEHIPHMT